MNPAGVVEAELLYRRLAPAVAKALGVKPSPPERWLRAKLAWGPKQAGGKKAAARQPLPAKIEVKP